MDLNWNSKTLTNGWQRGVQAFYWGLGLKEEGLSAPQVGIGVPLLDGNLCNSHALQLVDYLRDSCRNAGLIPFPFGVSPASDNLVQSLEDGGASLVSRNMIANGCEMVCSAHHYDAIIGMHHCDKNGPGFAMALARTNYPGLIVNGGTILPGDHCGRPTTILDVYAAQAQYKAGLISQDEAEKILRTACPGPGGCGIAASFNTWGLALEALGLALINSSSIPAAVPEKHADVARAGAAVRILLERNIRPRDIVNRQSLVNAMTTIAAIGGSTNGVLHMLALAREAHVDFGLDDIQAICRKTPVYCNFAPRGHATMYDLHKLGGSGVLLKHLLDLGLLDGNCMTVSGQTLADSLADFPEIDPASTFVANKVPFKSRADIQICFGNLAPDGIVFKVTAENLDRFEGTALVFESPRDVETAAVQGRIKPGTVVVLRNLGPVAAGMPEVHIVSAALALPELKGRVALVSDTRVSGVSSGIIGVHCSPESRVGGPIAQVQDGDRINFDLVAGTIDWQPSNAPSTIDSATKKYHAAYLHDFAATVSQASEGCVSKWVLEG
jgi:dihydroxy-acid dehydratase